MFLCTGPTKMLSLLRLVLRWLHRHLTGHTSAGLRGHSFLTLKVELNEQSSLLQSGISAVLAL